MNTNPVVMGVVHPCDTTSGLPETTYRLVRVWAGPIKADDIKPGSTGWKFVVEYQKKDAMGGVCWYPADDSVVPWAMGTILNKVARLD